MRADGLKRALCVVPSTTTLMNTGRSFSAQLQDLVEKRFYEVSCTVALGPGVFAQANCERTCPATANIEAKACFVTGVVQKRVGCT